MVDGLKLGIVTPVLTMLPRAHARWEQTGAHASATACNVRVVHHSPAHYIEQLTARRAIV